VSGCRTAASAIAWVRLRTYTVQYIPTLQDRTTDGALTVEHILDGSYLFQAAVVLLRSLLRVGHIIPPR
jgi:hypothetical protein